MSANLREDVMQLFHITATDEQLISECVNMCQMLNLSAEDLFFKWEAFSYSDKQKLHIFTLDAAQALRMQIQRNLASEASRKQQASKGSVAFGLNKARQSGLFLRNKTQGTSSARPTIIPASSSTSGRDASNEKQNTETRLSKVTFEGPKVDETSFRKRSFRYMYEKISERSEALDDKIDEIAELIRHHYHIQDLGDPSTSTEEDVVVIGRIALDIESSSGPAKLNEASVMLESSRLMGSGARVLLKFHSNIKIQGCLKGAGGISLFPGAIVALKGRNGGGGWFLVNEIYSIPPLKPPPSSSAKVESERAPFSLFIASGPYTPDTDLDYLPWRSLFETIKKTQPSVVLLIGPFVDSAHPKIKNGDIDSSPAEIFRSHFMLHLQDFVDLNPGSLVLVVPSVKDIISHHAVYPQCELEDDLAPDPRIRLLPNPCTFSLNGVSFAVTSVDVLFHLRKEELFKSAVEVEPIPSRADEDPAGHMNRLCQNLLDQRSFYPIFPVPNDVSHEINLDISHTSEGLKLGISESTAEGYAPNVLVVPSRLRQFSKVVHNTVAVNPSSLTKWAYATLEFAGGHSLDPVQDRIKVEVNKLGS